MKREVFVGIDTSNYTTSLAIVDKSGELVANLKMPLPVKAGERGLRQSDAVFAHVKNLPKLLDAAERYLADSRVLAIGVSERPRNVEGSYMPCFLSGAVAAKSLSVALSVPLYSFSHQCGHIMAALYSSGALALGLESFGAMHVSGGTTELLSVRRCEEGGFDAELRGGTRDLNAGQVIDRVGVTMGLPFPAGPHLERLALSYTGKIHKKQVSTDGTYMNLSGLENMATSLYKERGDAAEVAAFVLEYIGSSLLSVTESFLSDNPDLHFVYAGGVMCNSIIKNKLSGKIKNVHFATPDMSADNAVGIACLAREKYNP